MLLKVLGCSGAELPEMRAPAFLLDGTLLLDAGTVGTVLNESEQLTIRQAVLTHSHLDHIKGLPLLADNIILRGAKQQVEVLALQETLDILHQHLFNGLIWPDFTKIPNATEPVLRFRELPQRQTVQVGDYSVTACPVHHSVPAAGIVVEKGSTALLYTGDTGPTDDIWRLRDHYTAVIVEVSFPDALEDMARLTGHLTPSLLQQELAKCPCRPQRIFVTHVKPQYFQDIRTELHKLAIPGVELLKDGAIYNLAAASV